MRRDFSLALDLAKCMATCHTSYMKKRTTIWLDEADKAAVAVIKERYGAASDSDAIRLAVRLLAESKRVDIRDESETGSRGDGAQDLQGEAAANA